MRHLTSFFLAVCLMTRLSAQAPNTLLHSIPAPFGTAQSGAQLGYSVAVEGDYVVVGAPNDDIGGTNSGVVKVFDSSTGVLLFLLTNPAPAANDYFGWSLAISGTRVAVGAYQDDTGATDTGSVYVYDLSSGTPTLPVTTLNNPSPAAADYFGASVAISGTRVVAGAYQVDMGATNAGSAYVYDLSSGTPTTPVATLNNPGPAANDNFGYSVAVSGTQVVVGAWQDDTGASNAGSAYVYDLSSGTPTVPVVTLNNPSPAAGDYYGNSVAISGTRVVAGAFQDDTGTTGAGSAYVYDLSSGTPTVPMVTLNNPSLAANDFFGRSVSISGTQVVVGAFWDDMGATDAGSAYVYDLNSGTPTLPVATLDNPGQTADDLFGKSVAISGTRVLVGAYKDDTGATDAGSAYVYDLSSGTPTVPVVMLNNPGPVVDDRFGTSVAIAGTRLVVGAYRDDTGATDAGSAYVYDLSSSTPTLPVTTLNNPAPAAGDNFGYAVAISGARVVVGAYGDNTAENNVGSVYVYDLTSSTPTVPVVTLNNPSPTDYDQFGYAVAISGARVVVGALWGDTGATDAGSAYVYDLSSGTPTVPVVTLNNPGPAVNNYFGFSVAISGTRVVVGASFDDTGGIDTGSAYVYDLSSATSSVPVLTLINPSPDWGDHFGASVTVSGTQVVVGAYGDNTGANNAGSAYVYDLTSSTPTVPVATLNNPGPAASDYFGFSVAISGTRLVVGTYQDDTGATDAGSAYVYDLTSGTPTVPVATLNNPSPAVVDSFGYSMAIDGATVAIGTPYDDTVIHNKGSAYIFGPAQLSPSISKVQTIVFTTPLKLFLAESPVTFGASTSSGLAIAYTVVSGPATVLGNLLTLTGTGTVKVRASQPGNADFLAATPVERTITVAANPTTLTLTNLSQTYTGTPRPITVLGAAGEVIVTYKVGLSYVPDAPINVGSYPVKAVAGAITKTGTLVITKAPLFVQPDDQRKFAGQVNPVLGFGYSGFLGSDNTVNSVAKAPVIATTATVTSAGGLHPITASGGSSANYLFVYLKGTMKVETFAALYEALLVDAGTQRPAAKLELTVAASSKTFTGKLTTPTETAAVALNGTLGAPTLNETATGTATVKKGANTYLVTVTMPLTGDFTAEAKLNGATLGTATNGKKLLTLATGQTLSYIGTHSGLLAPATAGVGVPAGAGWAVATIDAKGLLKLTGKLADGTGLTASLAADVGSNPGYRLFVQPYLPARTGAFMAGAFTLKPQLDPGLTGRRYVAFEDAADLTWVKAPRLLDTSYRAGFSPVTTRFTLDPWLPPAPAKTGVPAITLTQRLGLTANQFTAQHSTISSAYFADLPTTLGLNATTNAVSVIAPVTSPANITKWKVTLTPATGAFVGSFELNDGGKKRAVPFTGMMRQPPSTDTSGLIGDGNFLLPSLTPAPNNEVLSGEVGFER